ncbi:MAG: HAMP domain-containing protein [Acidobacteria bacterium]|nr:HAMP domain-containing protein [Acidobacteriota bacterium]
MAFSRPALITALPAAGILALVSPAQWWICGLGVLFLGAMRVSSRWQYAAILLWIVPFSLKQKPAPAPHLEPFVPILKQESEPDPALWQALLQEFREGKLPAQFSWSLPEPYLSLTVLNLNRENVYWTGAMASDQALPGRGLQWVIADGRIWLRREIPFPNPNETKGYLVYELLFGTTNAPTNQPTFLRAHTDLARNFSLTEVNANPNGLLSQLSQSLGTDLPQVDVLPLMRIQREGWEEVVFLLWALVWAGVGLFHARNQRALAWLVPVLTLLALAWLRIRGLEGLSALNSNLFGALWWGQLARTPLHLFALTCLLAMLFIGLSLNPKGKEGLQVALCTIGLSLSVLLPFAIDANAQVAILEPMMVWRSPGSALLFLSLALAHGSLLLLINGLARHLSGTLKLVVPIGVLSLWIVPALRPAVSNPLQAFILATSLILIWSMACLQIPNRMRLLVQAGLCGMLFFPVINQRDQQKQLDQLRFPLVDEITLLHEKNHFRIARLVNAVEDLSEERNIRHPQSMLWLARRCGLLDEDIAFGLQLTAANGDVLSVVENYLTMAEIPFPLFPEERIEQFSEGERGANWLVFRKSLANDLNFSVVLANDYHNLSLLRKMRRFLGASAELNPNLFQTGIEVFNRVGEPLFYSFDPEPLQAETREKLIHNPAFWDHDGDRTAFLFRNENTYYRLTYLQTPDRLVFARFLTLSFLIWLAATGLRLFFQPKRHGWQIFRRSFALKLAALIFIGGFLPVSLSVFTFSKSLQTNLEREVRSTLQTKLKAGVQAYEELRLNSTDPAMGSNTSFLSEISRIAGEQVSIYRSGSLWDTTQPEVFRNGILARRLPMPWYREVLEPSTPYVLKALDQSQGTHFLVGLMALPHANQQQILAMTLFPNSQRQMIRMRNHVELAIALLIGLMLILANLTLRVSQNALKPVRDITLGAARLGRGLSTRIALSREDELDQMVRAFNAMQNQILDSQEALTHQLGLFDVTLQAMTSGLLGCDAEGNILIHNAQAREILDWPIPTHLADLKTRFPACEPIVNACFEGGQGEWTVSLMVDEKPREILFKLRSRQFSADQEIQYILVFNDITHLLEANRFQAWSEMARRVAHDIKNPLTPIQLEIDHLKRVYRDKPENFAAVLDEATHEIKGQIEHLRQIATEFADYARPVSLEPVPTDLVALWRKVLAGYQHKPGLVLEVEWPEEDLWISADTRYLLRAFHNLVENAVQAQGEESWLHLKFHTRSDRIQVQIQDRGPGIEESMRHKIFEAYFSTKERGSGLGLPIAKKIIELHQGLIWLDPNPEIGTCFWIDLPRLTTPQ